jgi:hypothetical protein
MHDDLVMQRPEGLYCRAGDFYIDPWRPVDRAVITQRTRTMRASATRVRPACRCRSPIGWMTSTGQALSLRLSLLRRRCTAAPGARRFGASDAFASGWMQLRGARRRRAVDRGFVLSAHADWPGLQRAIAASGARRVILTHGYEAVMVRWLAEQGFEAGAFETEYGDEAMENTANAKQG